MSAVEEAGVPFQVLSDLRRAISPWHDARAYQQLKRSLRGFAPEVVHTHSAKGGVLGRFAAHALGVPAIVHTVHGAPFHEYQNPIVRAGYRWCERQAARRCHALVSVADAMTERMVAGQVAPREKFCTVYSGMEVEPFLNAENQRAAMRDQLAYRAEDVVFSKVARLAPLKGHDDFVAAAQCVHAQLPSARFLLVGDGSLRHQIEHQIHAAGLQRCVQLVGLVPPEQIPAYLAASDVVVHTSLREGLARVLPQAMLAGRPVISYDIDGAREVVIAEQTGLLVPPRQVVQLANAMMRLGTSAAERDAWGANGRARCTDRFRCETMTQRLRELYQRLLRFPTHIDL